MDTENYFCELILTFKSKQFSEKKNLIAIVVDVGNFIIQVPETKIK